MGIASISSNIHAQYAAGNVRNSLDGLKTSAIRLSSGNRITQASDDAAGLSIGTGLKTDESTLRAALTTAGQAGSILSIADGALDNVSKILARLKSLASQANSGAMGSTELGYIKQEMQALGSQVDSIVATTKFNGTKLLDGAYSNKAFQVGLSASDTISISFSQADQAGLSINAIDVTTDIAGANTALDTAISSVKSMRSGVGALQSRFGYASSNLETGINNLGAAKAGYLEADIAQVSTDFATQQTQMQAGVATLASVNQLTSNLLKLIS
ncbi:MAG: flagellin [Alphaproteobacteria bacterium]|jgi:flagellin|nr:hypothetical protein [Candidatus Jidaibacter sp.]